MAPHLDLGDMSITWLEGGRFELDGGTMFGAVPKILWNKAYPADADNYIPMLAAPLLIKTPSTAIVIDTGLGNKLSAKQKAIFRVQSPWNLPRSLAASGMDRRDIDWVVLTHCDFDHAGGIVTRTDQNEACLTFPNARHVINRIEWYDANHPNSRSAHTYFAENIAVLADSGRLHLIDKTFEVIPEVTVRHTGGHTRGHQLVELNGRHGSAVHFGDLMPTHAHAHPLWIMAYDNFPLDVIAAKQHLVARYRDRWFTFYHDAHMMAGKLNESGKIDSDHTILPSSHLNWRNGINQREGS